MIHFGEDLIICFGTLVILSAVKVTVSQILYPTPRSGSSMTLKNAKYAIPFLMAILLVPGGMAFAQQTPGMEEETNNTYEKADILHAFKVMEKYITLDENSHFIIDVTSAEIDEEVALIDIQIAERYAVYNDNIVEVIGAVGIVNELGFDSDEQLRLIIDDFEHGEFRELFSNNVGPIGNTFDVVYITYDITPIHHGAFGTWCGGAFHDPHESDPNPTTYSGANSLMATQNHLINNGYHMTAEYASWQGSTSQPYDFSKQVPSSGYSGLCDYGAFRDHAGILNNFSYRVQEEEPNPELLSYIWPSPFWGLYTAWWHDNY